MTTPTLQATELTGMGIGGLGALNADDAGLRSSFDPNTDDAGATAAGPGDLPTLTGGSTLTGEMDGFDAASVGDIDSPPAGWVMKTLFRDWGDTQGDGDGGYETAAIVVKNLGPPTTHPWNAMLVGRFANDEAGGPAASAYGLDSDTVAGSDSVPFTVAGAMSVPANSQIDAGATGTAALEAIVGDSDEASLTRVLGTYRGVRGSYTCMGDCDISRATGGSTPYTLGDGMWRFRPDPGAMVQVPDQDWMVYGAWMTTPDNPDGDHRIGTFFNGMDVYDTANIATLTGSAEYNGGATGVYVDGEDSGLFTATATLTANFTDPDAAPDNMISGRIHDFRGTDGVFLGTDTAAMPNDPDAGGENDWVVLLEASLLADIGTDSGTEGSADGVQWMGMWSGGFFGPEMDGDDAVAPSGVAGEFRASTVMAGTTAAGNTAVVGAFGATKDE